MTDPQKIYEELKRRQADIFAGVGIGAEPNVKMLLADNIPIPQSDGCILWVSKDTAPEVVDTMLKCEAGLCPITVAEAESTALPEPEDECDPDDEYEGWIDGKNY